MARSTRTVTVPRRSHTRASAAKLAAQEGTEPVSKRRKTKSKREAKVDTESHKSLVNRIFDVPHEVMCEVRFTKLLYCQLAHYLILRLRALCIPATFL